MFNKTIVFILAVISLSAVTLSIPSNRIVGGGDVDIKNFPYQLSLRNTGSHICGASIISNNWAVTAAQCVDGVRDISIITLVAATNSITDGGHVHTASEILIHPNYDIVYKEYDIALIKVKDAFHIGSDENIIKLANKEADIGASCTISGWGFTQESHLSSTLKSVTVPIISQQECQNDYPKRDITERVVCAGLAEGGRDFCDGDTGGGLIYNDELVGVASWGYGCALPNLSGVYTSVPHFIEWIKEVTGI